MHVRSGGPWCQEKQRWNSSRSWTLPTGRLCLWRFGGPIHQAIERHAPGTPAWEEVHLPASDHFGKLAIGAVALGPTLPLLEVSAYECFWLLPLCFLRQLAHHLSEEYTKIGLVDTCVFLTDVINECTTKD